MVGIMDCYKNVIIGLLAVFALCSLASAQFIIDPSGNQVLDYANEPLVGLEISLQNNSIQTVRMNSNYGLNTHYIIFQVVAESPQPTTKLEVACAYKNDTNITLSDYPTWLTEGYAYVYLTTYDASLSTYYPGNVTNIIDSSRCDLKAWGQDLIITSYINTKETMERVSGFTFSSPNPTLENLVGTNQYSGVRGLMNSAFILLDLFIMITAVVIFTMLLVFPAKIVEFFASRIRRND
jgi:hypothetical protein